MELKKILGGLAIAATMAFAPMTASAVVVNMDTDLGLATDPGFPLTPGTHDIATRDVYRFNNIFFSGADAAGADYGFAFESSVIPLGTNTTVTLNVLGDFTDLQIAWSADTVIDVADTLFSIASNDVAQTFTFTSAAIQYLLVSYDEAANGASLDIRVSAVPLPAGFLLLLTGVGGLALVGRRRRMAAAA